MSRFTKGILIVASLIVWGMSGCGERQAPVSKEKKLPEAEKIAEKPAAPAGKPLSICVGAMITPEKGYGLYKQVLDHIGKKMNRPIRYVDKTTYAELNNMLKQEQVDVGFVCAGPYVTGHADFGLELLVAPQTKGDTVYYSYIIVPRDSPANSLADLRGKNFAFTDPNSNTGRLVPTFMLSRMGQTPDSFFEKTIFSYAHDKSIQLVANGMVDGAAVDSLIWEYNDKFNPEYTSKTKVIQKSAPYGIPPVVVRPGLDAGTKAQLRQLFLDFHKTPEGQAILDNMLIEKFVLVEDSRYDSIREMEAFIAKQTSRGSVTPGLD